MTRVTVALFSVAVAACATPDAGDDTFDPGKGDVDQSCRDPRYGDGVCQLDLGCGVPDADCFLTFPDDAAAARWFAGLEQQLAAAEGRPPRAFVPASDPRVARVRELLDLGWSAYRTTMPVGEALQAQRPGLIVVEDAIPNAFAFGDPQSHLAALALVVHTGLLDLGGDDAGVLGVLMHELGHTTRLHLVGDMRDRLRRFYVAGVPEPIGAFTSDDPRARAAAVPWRAAGVDAGPYTDRELGGFPLGGALDRILRHVELEGVRGNPAGCVGPEAQVSGLRADLVASIDPFDGTLGIDRATLAARVGDALGALRDGCLAGYPKTFIDVLAEMLGVTPEQAAAGLTIGDRVLVSDRHVVDAIAALAADRRAAMRRQEGSFTTQTGAPWSSLRFFSFEEDADDSSEPVLRALGLPAWGEANVLERMLGADAGRCMASVQATGTAPYGVDYVDEHHALCWRIGHLLARAAAGAGDRARPLPPGTAMPQLRSLLGRSVLDHIAF